MAYADLVTAGLNTAFLQKLTEGETASYVAAVATVLPSTKATETLAWIGESPALAAWDGQPRFTGMNTSTYAITHVTYQGGIELRKEDFDDDQAGALSFRIAQLAEAVVENKNTLLMNALINGDATTGFDGSNFFANSHAARGDSGNADNLLAGSGTTTANFQTDITQGIAAMLGFLKENGKPFHANPRMFQVVAPPAIMGSMEEAIGAAIVSNTSNVRNARFVIDTIYSAEIGADDANDWYLLHTGGSVRPLVMTDREPASLVMDDTTTLAIDRKMRWSLAGRWKEGYGHHGNAVKIVNT